MDTRDTLGRMPAVADLRTKERDHVCFLRLPFADEPSDLPGVITLEVEGAERCFRFVGKLHGLPTYDECYHWHAPKELISNDTPVVTARVSDAILSSVGYDDLPDTTPAPPSSEKDPKQS
jgi:hypothetical protein